MLKIALIFLAITAVLTVDNLTVQILFIGIGGFALAGLILDWFWPRQTKAEKSAKYANKE